MKVYDVWVQMALAPGGKPLVVSAYEADLMTDYEDMLVLKPTTLSGALAGLAEAADKALQGLDRPKK